MFTGPQGTAEGAGDSLRRLGGDEVGAAGATIRAKSGNCCYPRIQTAVVIAIVRMIVVMTIPAIRIVGGHIYVSAAFLTLKANLKARFVPGNDSVSTPRILPQEI